ncbi:InlB B-repeat-containing protein [Coprobacillus cateniformis]|uniref:InlB B-repeat-containing protein n=1 Tax=Coprobacillus cateniformis TaxID=100884 RepID=UPI0039A12EE6
MKMRKTKIKFMSLLLAVMMIVGVLPTTALAATYNDVKVNGVSLGDGKYLASNSATDSNYSNTEPSSYVAWYKDGTLTLNGYKGTGIVLQGAPAADLIIKLIGDNTITTTTNEVGIQGNSAAGSITITADSGSNGNLTIDMTHSTRPVFGINGYANSVTITGSADVKITAVATATDQESFGIKSSKAVSILDSASVGITCKTPNSTSRSDTCNGIYSDTGVTINTDGTIQIDVHEAGDEAYSYGINSMGTLTLTKVGGMTVKWKKAGVQGSPLLPSSASFDPTAYDTHKDTTDTTNCVATYMPKGTTPTTYTVSFDANGGTGTMADVTDISGEYTLPANGFTAPVGKQFKAWSVGGVEKAAGDKITVTANTTVTAVWEPIPVTTYDLTTSVNGGHGTISASKTGLTAGSTETITFNPEVGYEIDTVTVNGTATSVSGNTLNVTMNENKTVVVTYKAIEYNITVTDGKATIGAGSEISKAAEGTAVTLTANAAPSDKVFDKWEVISGSITLADANSATTTFTMPASAVSVKATYKNAPHTHTYNQETVKPEALKTPADCTGNAVYFKSCSCGAISTTDAFVAMNTALGHAYGSDWKYDSTNHWHECSRCHDKKDEAAHDYGSDNVCDTCGYYKTVPHTHNLTLVAAKAATCTEGGKEAYYKCEGCGKFYEDVLGTKEITDLASWGNIAKIAHTTKQTVTKATPTANGKIVNYCSVCKKTLSTTVIPKASSIKLKATSLTYNGKVRTPKVIVKDRTGKTLVKNTDYTVSYAKGRKYVGKYAVKITFKGKYSGTKTLYFTIKPKATSISSLKAGSKKFTVKWKKQATQTTGYQVQYSASSKFSKAKTVTVGKNTTVSKKISKLSGKKKYYVRVRTYKTVKINGKSIRIYSGWSKAKTVTTKK